MHRGNTMVVKIFQVYFTDTPYWVPSQDPLGGDDVGCLEDFTLEEIQYAYREAWAYHSLHLLHENSLL